MADDELHSAVLRVVALHDLPPTIRAAAVELASLTATKEPIVLVWNDHYVAVPIIVDVNLPARGTGGLDIRAREPLIVLFNLKHYPRRAPLVHADRKSFPGDDLPHVNPTGPGQATSLCLHRGNLDHWFAERTLVQLIERAQGWLADAAAGLLIRADDRFEQIRHPDSSRIWVADPVALEADIRRAWERSDGQPGFAVFWSWLSSAPRADVGWSASLALDIYGVREPSNTEGLHQIRALCEEWNNAHPAGEKAPRLTLGLLLWPAVTPNARYFAQLPDSFGAFEDFCTRLGVPLAAALARFVAAELQLLKGVPIVVAIPRPTQLIGRASSIDLLGFLHLMETAEARPADHVFILGHRNALTSEFARALSATKGDISMLEKPLLLGCGAIGSKVSLHLAKSGFRDQLLVDNATLAPHHAVRHALPGGHLGENKADAVASVITELFAGVRDAPEVKAVNGDALDVLQDVASMSERTILIDGTASPTVLDALVDADIPSAVRVVRIEIADQGRLGLLSAEGAGRNPRLDDVRAFLFEQARADERLAAWLRRHREEVEAVRGPVLEDIGIGISCDTETMRIADDLASLHAARFSRDLRRLAADRPSAGRLAITFHSMEDEEPEVGSRTWPVPPVMMIPVEGLPEWVVRVSSPVLERMTLAMRRASPRETGGILLGHTSGKRHVLYVTAALEQPGGGSRRQFTRDARFIEPAILAADRTANLIAYVGDWHTHPSSTTRPSPTDLNALGETARRLRQARLPAVILILGADGLRAVGMDHQ